ncbi:MAG: hypothetical protein AAF282_22800, partial [Cyanobacteria bacterium P01_A01_bin.15]
AAIATAVPSTNPLSFMVVLPHNLGPIVPQSIKIDKLSKRYSAANIEAANRSSKIAEQKLASILSVLPTFATLLAGRSPRLMTLLNYPLIT